MIQLTYVSSTAKLFSTDELFEMLLDFKMNNGRSKLTGLLLYCGGSFLQVIEGSAENVESLYEKICKDSRHNDCTILFKDNIDQRSFGQWEMGFKRLSNLNLRNIRGYSALLEDGLTKDQLLKYSEHVLKALDDFKDTNVN